MYEDATPAAEHGFRLSISCRPLPLQKNLFALCSCFYHTFSFLYSLQSLRWAVLREVQAFCHGKLHYEPSQAKIKDKDILNCSVETIQDNNSRVEALKKQTKKIIK